MAEEVSAEAARLEEKARAKRLKAVAEQLAKQAKENKARTGAAKRSASTKVARGRAESSPDWQGYTFITLGLILGNFLAGLIGRWQVHMIRDYFDWIVPPALADVFGVLPIKMVLTSAALGWLL